MAAIEPVSAAPDQPTGQQATMALGLNSPSGAGDATALASVSPDLRNTSFGRPPDQAQAPTGGVAAPGGAPDRVDNWETRNFNYGGLRIPGSTVGPEAGGFQQFSSPEQGVAAIASQLDRYTNGATTGKPLQTLREIVSTWAPPSENDTHLLIHRASAVMGVDPDQPLNLGDPKTRAKLIEATIRNEQGGKLPVDPAVIQQVANDPSYQPAPDAMVNRFDQHAGLLNTAMGPFSGQAKTLVDQALSKMNRDTSSHDEAMAEAKDMRSFERAAMARWMAQSEHPPKNMHENWQQWGGIAQLFALVGPLFGKRSATAALNAAGDMMQAANAADQHTYDTAYKQWKDHNESMLKAVELFHNQYREIIEADNKSWDHKQAEIGTLLTAAGVVSRFDEQTFAKQEQALRIAKERADLTKAQNEDSEIRLSAEAKNQQYRDAHEGQEPPASVKNQNMGEAKRERAGTGGIREEVDRQIYSTTYASRIAAGDTPDEATKKAASAVKDRGAATPAKGDEAAIEKAVASDMAKFDKDNPNAPKEEREKAEYQSRLLHRGEMGAASRPPRSAPAMALQTFIQEKIQKDGRPPTADEIQTFAAVGAEKMREGAAVGTRSGNLAMAGNAAEALIPLVRQTSEKINRTEFPSLNSMIIAAQKGTGGTDVVKFMEMINSLKYLYARALSPTGQARVADLANFDKIMSENWTKGQINAGLDQIQQSINVEKGAIAKTRTEIAGGGIGAGTPQADTLQKPTGAEPMPVPAGAAGDPDGTGYRKDGKIWVKQGGYLIETPNAVETK